MFSRCTSKLCRSFLFFLIHWFMRRSCRRALSPPPTGCILLKAQFPYLFKWNIPTPSCLTKQFANQDKHSFILLPLLNHAQMDGRGLGDAARCCKLNNSGSWNISQQWVAKPGISLAALTCGSLLIYLELYHEAEQSVGFYRDEHCDIVASV